MEEQENAATSQQDLISAIRDGDVDQVKNILHASGLLQQLDLRGHLLLIAIEEDQTEVVSLLCADGKWSNVVRSDDLSSIHVACKYGNVQIIETLLRNGAEVNGQTPEHLLTPLLMAVRWRQKDAVCHLLDSGADANLSSGRYSHLTTPLHEAVATVNEDIINYLLARNADVNAANGRRRLPLHVVLDGTGNIYGIGPARLRVAKRLISCGSNVMAEDSLGNTPLHLAVASGAYDGKLETVRLLCVAGALINAYNNDGETPLHRAAVGENGKNVDQNAEVVECLIHFGANVNKASVGNTIPLQKALLGQYAPKLADILIEAGSDINHTDPSTGETIFHRITSCWGNLESIRYLMRKGVNYNTVSRKKISPLTAACGAGHRPSIHLICSECPALLDPRSKLPEITGRPLQCIVKLSNLDMLLFLLNAGYRWSRAELQYLLEWPALLTDVALLIKGLLDNGQPNSLKTICRDAIRLRLHDFLWEKVRELHIPESLKKHLLLHDVRMCESSFDYHEV